MDRRTFRHTQTTCRAGTRADLFLHFRFLYIHFPTVSPRKHTTGFGAQIWTPCPKTTLWPGWLVANIHTDRQITHRDRGCTQVQHVRQTMGAGAVGSPEAAPATTTGAATPAVDEAVSVVADAQADASAPASEPLHGDAEGMAPPPASAPPPPASQPTTTVLAMAVSRKPVPTRPRSEMKILLARNAERRKFQEPPNLVYFHEEMRGACARPTSTRSKLKQTVSALDEARRQLERRRLEKETAAAERRRLARA